jgi:hypothetical protein
MSPVHTRGRKQDRRHADSPPRRQRVANASTDRNTRPGVRQRVRPPPPSPPSGRRHRLLGPNPEPRAWPPGQLQHHAEARTKAPRTETTFETGQGSNGGERSAPGSPHRKHLPLRGRKQDRERVRHRERVRGIEPSSRPSHNPAPQTPTAPTTELAGNKYSFPTTTHHANFAAEKAASGERVRS